MENKITLGFLGAPGTGKGTAMEIVMQNQEHIKQLLNLSNFSVYLARKFTTRPTRAGETDKVGDQSIHNVISMVGSYQLMGKHWYGYPQEELQHEADLILMEPSIHQINDLRDNIDGKFYVVGLIKSRELREQGLRHRVANGDTTMDENEIQKRLDEGDAQTDEIIKAHVSGAIDAVWEMDESLWSNNPIVEGKFREQILQFIQSIYEI